MNLYIPKRTERGVMMIGSDESYNFQCFNFVGEYFCWWEWCGDRMVLIGCIDDCKHDLDGVTPSTLGKTVT